MNEKEIIVSPDTQRPNRVPPGQYLTRDWPVLHYGNVPAISPENWKLRIFGQVKQEVTLTWTDFERIPTVKVFADIHCVTTWSRLDNLWEGVSLTEMRKLVEVLPSAAFVMVYGANNFSTNLPLDDFFQPDVILATRHNSQPLSAEHGGPVRLVVPRLYFWKSAKWVTGIEFTAKDRPGFWEKAGYHNHGDPWKEERYG